MIGIVRTPIGGSSLRLPPTNSTGSTSNLFSGGGRIYKVSMHAVQSVAESTARRRESLYEVLRIERNATPTEIKTAYRSLAKVYHPDASDDKLHGDRDFIEIHNAYATLSDPEARATYDMKWSTGMRRSSGLYTAVGKRQGFYTTRRWETDQCW